MTRIMESTHTWETKLDRKVEYFSSYHPYLAYFAVLIGMPLFILGAVFLSTIVVMLPFGLIFG